MKVLFTGYTPRGVGSTKLLYSYMSNTSVIIKTLRAAGHEVDQRTVDVDDVSIADQYDVAMVSLAVPQSLSSRFQFGAMWTAEQFGPERTRFVVDDWLLHQFASQLKSGLREPEKRYYSLPQRHCYEAAKKHTALWVKWNTFFLKGHYKLLLPAFPWAVTSRMLPELSNVQGVIFDPTPLALVDPEVFCGDKDWPDLTPIDQNLRERAWTLAAMREVKPWLDKQAFEWPVKGYGNKRQDQEVLTEKTLIQDIYRQRWGILGAPYPVVTGGGGWRARYVHAALTRSILFLDPDEAKVAGAPYQLFRTIVEKASTDQLVDIAEQQRYHLLNNTWTLDHLTSALDAYVRGT